MPRDAGAEFERPQPAAISEAAIQAKAAAFLQYTLLRGQQLFEFGEVAQG